MLKTSSGLRSSTGSPGTNSFLAGHLQDRHQPAFRGTYSKNNTVEILRVTEVEVTVASAETRECLVKLFVKAVLI